MNLTTTSQSGARTERTFSGGITGHLSQSTGKSQGQEVHVKTPMGGTYVVRLHGATLQALMSLQKLYGSRIPALCGMLTIIKVDGQQVNNPPKVPFTLKAGRITISTSAETPRLRTSFQTAS